MKQKHPKALTSTGRPEPISNAIKPELPDFVIIPRIPGLPAEVTGGALRAALQSRAEAGVTIHRS